MVDCKEQRTQRHAGKLFEKTVGTQASFLFTAAAAPINREKKTTQFEMHTGIIP